jgi:hydrogenase nickel incorporation protein HypA/HybF
MHELSLAQGIVDIVADAARAESFSRVTRIKVVVGGLAPVEPDALAFGFEVVAKGTVAEGARLELSRPPGLGRCAGCDREVPLAQRGEACPGCGGYEIVVTAGDELRVTELEVE